MPKTTKYPKTAKAFKRDPLFYEELTLLKAQEKIAELMKENNISKTELAALLNQSKAHVTELLSDGRNLTLKTFGRICFHLNAELDFQTYLIGARHSLKQSVNDSYLYKDLADQLRSNNFSISKKDSFYSVGNPLVYKSSRKQSAA